MNKAQKIILYVCLLIIMASFLLWILHGGEIFTKFKMLVEAQTELEKEMGISHKEWVDTFIWGLDYTLGVTGVTAVIGFVAGFLLKTKKRS